jgi:hypothetical protein
MPYPSIWIKKDFRRANVKKIFYYTSIIKKSEEHLRVKNEEKPPAYSLLFYSVLITKKEVSPREGKILLFEINLKLKK